jgi:hypothetical protein
MEGCFDRACSTNNDGYRFTQYIFHYWYIYSICRRSTQVRYQITNATVDLDLFSMEIEAAIAMRFLRAGDVLVLDNAASHTGKGNTVLEDWLWEEHSVFVLFLPA